MGPGGPTTPSCATQPSPRLGARAARRAPRRYGRDDAAERARDARCPLRHPGGRRGDQRAERAARGRHRCLHPGSRRGQGAADRPRIRARDRGRARTGKAQTARGRRAGPGVRRAGGAAGRAYLRRAAGRGRSRLRAALSGRRMAGDRARLHLRDDGPAQGRGHPPPRRLPERDRRHPGLEHGAAPDLLMDAAHVPLQRLVFPVGGDAAGGHAGVPAPGRAGHDLCRARRAQGHASVRRACDHGHADQRHGRRAARLRP